MCQKPGRVLDLSSVTFYYLSVAIFSLLFHHDGRQGIFVLGDLPSSSYFVYRRNSLALLSGTLRTYQKAACDEAWVSLECPEGTTISIQFAQYGKTASAPALCKDPSDLHSSTPTNNSTCLSQKAIQTVVSLCQKKTVCKFQATPRTFGSDPCPYARKFVEVAYKCRPSQFQSVIGCENDVVKLSCNPGSRLAIYSGNFGRTEYESLTCSQPARVQEETCLASYATETVMQMCHGKRRCSIAAESATFGRPCRPQSRMYLKVIHTCVPRKVLKEKYQGELEPDETEEDDEADDGANDSTSRIIEQSSIPSSNHPSGSEIALDSHSTQEVEVFKSKSGLDLEEDNLVKSSAVQNSEGEIRPIEANNVSLSGSGNSQDVRFINLISQSMNAYEFIERNSHTFWLLVAISMLSVFLLLLFLLLIRLVYVRHKGSKEAREEQRMKSSSIRRASGLSDIDELSLVMDPNEYIHLSTIQRRSNPSSGSSSALAKNKVVRYSNSRASMLGRQESDTNPRSFNQEHESDIHFFFG